MLNVDRCVKEHMKAFSKWNEGKVIKSWYEEDGTLCIKYESGNWWHYRLNSEKLEWF